MKILVVDIKTNKVEIEVGEYESIGEIKQKLKNKTNLKDVKDDSIILSYCGEILEDFERVNFYDIMDMSAIMFHGQFRGFGNMKAVIVLDSKEDSEEVDIDDNEYVKDLKKN